MSLKLEIPKNSSAMIEWMRRISSRATNKLIYAANDSVGNAAGVATALHSYTMRSVPGGYFWRGDGQYVKVTSRGSFAANVNNKTLDIKFSNAVFSFSQPINGGSYYAEVDFYKLDISTLAAKGVIWTTNAVYPIAMGGIGYAAAGVRVGEAATIKSEATAAGANDITETYFRVEMFPSPDAY